MPGWIDIVDQTIELAKAKLFSLLKSLDDPKARADLAFAEYKEVTILLKNAGILMRAKRNQIVSFKGRVDDKITEAHSKATQSMKQQKPEYASIYANLQAKLEKQSELCTNTVTNIDQRLKIIDGQIIDAGATEDLLEMVIETEKIRIDVANAEIQYGEIVTGVKKKGNSIYNAIKGLQTMREEREARGQALSEMAASGLIETVSSRLVPVDATRTDDILKQIDAELKKTNSQTDPELLGGKAQ